MKWYNKIYVATTDTDMVYIIDGITNNKINTVHAGKILGDITVDTNEFEGQRGLIFVANQGNQSISVIDDVAGSVVYTLNTSSSTVGIALDPMKNILYVTGNYSIDVFDYRTDLQRKVYADKVKSIEIGGSPFYVTMDASSSRAYVTNSATHEISGINTNTHEVIDSIQVGLFPASLAYNNKEGKLYVSNTGQGTVSVIDTKYLNNSSGDTEFKTLDTIKVDSIPYDIAINPETNIVYLANYESKTISLIDGAKDKRITKVLAEIFPSDTGGMLECDGQFLKSGEYERITVLNDIKGSNDCTLITNPGYVYDVGYQEYTKQTGNPNYTISLDTVSHLIKFLDNRVWTFNNITDFPLISSYGPYPVYLLSIETILIAGISYLSIGILILIIMVAVVKPIISQLTAKGYNLIKKNSNHHTIAQTLDEQLQDKRINREEIIGFDVAVIAGILIFLTISEGFGDKEYEQISIITATIVFPFAISAIFAIIEKQGLATRLMVAGFINLMIAVFLLAAMELFL